MWAHYQLRPYLPLLMFLIHVSEPGTHVHTQQDNDTGPAPAQEALTWAAEEGTLDHAGQQIVENVLRFRDVSYLEGVQAHGQSNSAVACLSAGLHIVLKSRDSYVRGVRRNIRAGGLSAARAHVVCQARGICVG